MSADACRSRVHRAAPHGFKSGGKQRRAPRAQLERITAVIARTSMPCTFASPPLISSRPCAPACAGSQRIEATDAPRQRSGGAAATYRHRVIRRPRRLPHRRNAHAERVQSRHQVVRCGRAGESEPGEAKLRAEAARSMAGAWRGSASALRAPIAPKPTTNAARPASTAPVGSPSWRAWNAAAMPFCARRSRPPPAAPPGVN